MRPLLVIAFGLVLLSGAAEAAQVLHRPNDGEPDTLDAQKSTGAYALAIDRDMFIGLVTLSPHGEAVPGVATDWTVSADKKVWTFHLRHDAKWSNGDPLTSADFIYSFRRLVDPKTAAADYSDLKQVVNAEEIVSGKEKDLTKLGITAPDPYTLVMTLKEPRLILPLALTGGMDFPVHKATIEKWGDTWTQPGHIVSNGPYVMKSWTPQSEIVLEKNPQFWDAASVKIDEVHWLNAEERETALRRYLGGELDWVQLNRNTLKAAREARPEEFHRADDNSYAFIMFNMTRGAWSKDRRIREAMSIAIDRNILVEKINPLGEKPAYSVTPPVISNYTPQDYAWKNEPMPDRLKRAKALMAEAGYSPDHPLAITISYPTQESTRQILLAIRAMWQPLGVTLELQNMEWQVFVGQVNTRNFDIGTMSLTGTYDDYESGLDNYRSDAGEYNMCAYSNPKFDELFHRGQTATDMATRRTSIEEAERVMLDDYPLIPLYMGILNKLVNPKLRGFVDSNDLPQSRYLSFAD
jgi:oligopeptide transport system substrate-binding protein